MKKFLAFLLLMTMLLGTASCGAENTVETDGSDTTVENTDSNTEASVSDDSTENVTESADSDVDTDESAAEDTDASESDLPKNDEALDDNGYFRGVKASEIVDLPDYKGIDVDRSVITAAEEDVQYQIDMALNTYGYVEYEQITDRAVVDGDMVNIDYVGSVDGVEFAGGNTGGMGTNVTVGVTSYIDDFLEQLIGHMPGETFNVEVTFPEDYGNEEVNGKDAVFVTTINYICGDALETELTDEIAMQLGYDSAAALVTSVEDWLIERQRSTFIYGLISQAVCEEIPQSVEDYLVSGDLASIESEAALYGITLEDYLMMYGYESKDAYIKEVTTMWLAFQAIAELEGLTVTDEMLAEQCTEEEIETYGEAYLKQYLLNNVVVPDFIMNNAVVVD